MKGKKRLTECEQKALVALKAEEIQEKAKKAKQREKKREMSTAKVRTALGGQQMSFQPQPQVEAPLRYQPQQQERSRLSDPWIGFGQNVALTLLNYGLMQAGRHQDRQMFAAQQQQKQQEKTVFKPEYKDVSLTDLKKGFGEISAIKKRKIETVAAAAFQTPQKNNKTERKTVVAKKGSEANKNSEAGGLFDKILNRTTQSTQTEQTSQTQEFGTQTETKQDRRNAIDKMGFEELLMTVADNQIHEDDRKYANNRVATLRSQLFAQNEQGKHFLETNSTEQNRSFFKESYKGGFIGSLTNTRGNVDPATGQTFLIVDGHRLNPDGSYELHAPGTLIQQTGEEAMAILKAVREQKLARILDKINDNENGYINATSRALKKLQKNKGEPENLNRYNEADMRELGAISEQYEKGVEDKLPPWMNVPVIPKDAVDEYIEPPKQPTTAIKPKINRPVITPPPTGGYDPKKLIKSLTSTDPVDLNTQLNTTSDTLFQKTNELIQRSRQNIQNTQNALEKSKLVLSTPRKNPIYAPSPSSLDQSPAAFGFHGPSAYPGSEDVNVKGFFNKVLFNAKGGTPATIMLGSSPSSWMTPSTQSRVQLTPFIGDRSINESNMQTPPPIMQSFGIQNVPEEDEYDNFGSGFDNPNIQDEYKNVGSSFTGEIE